MLVLRINIFLFLLFFVSHAFAQEQLTEKEKQELIEIHNEWREKVNCPPVEWSDEIADYAQEWGKHLKELAGIYKHRPYSGEWKQIYGENIFSGSEDNYKAKYVVDTWASEIKDYNGEAIDNQNYINIGHYTQIVWKTCKKIGCAKIIHHGRSIWICNYSPSGNIMGQKPY